MQSSEAGEVKGAGVRVIPVADARRPHEDDDTSHDREHNHGDIQPPQMDTARTRRSSYERQERQRAGACGPWIVLPLQALPAAVLGAQIVDWFYAY